MKHLYIFLGWLSVSLGVIGMILPVMPTTCFMLLGAYFFSRGSPRLHHLMRTCPKFGPIICEWEEYHVIRFHPKLMATGLMSFAVLVLWVCKVPMIAVLATVLTLLGVLSYIWTRPSTIEESLRRQQARSEQLRAAQPQVQGPAEDGL